MVKFRSQKKRNPLVIALQMAMHHQSRTKPSPARFCVTRPEALLKKKFCWASKQNLPSTRRRCTINYKSKAWTSTLRKAVSATEKKAKVGSVSKATKVKWACQRRYRECKCANSLINHSITLLSICPRFTLTASPRALFYPFKGSPCRSTLTR